MTNDNATPFVLEQLDEALEERQTPDRRKTADGNEELVQEDRRKENRRETSANKH